MKRLINIIPLFLILAMTVTDLAQGRAYAKFDRRGDTIGLFNLSGEGAECRERQLLTGTVLNLRSEVHEPDIAFSFILELGQRRRIISFTLRKDAIPHADVESLLIDKHRYQVNVAACQNGGRWIAEWITRSSN